MKRRDASAGRVIQAAVFAAVASAGLTGCPSSRYLIGALCPPDAGGVSDPRCAGGVDAGAGVTFAVAFDHSGATLLDDHLAVASGPVAATLRLRGEAASATGWTTEAGAVLGRATGTPTTALDAPFNDETRAVELAPDAPSYGAADGTLGAVGADDFALEIVIRAAAGARVLDKRAGGVGWSLQADATGVLALSLQDGTGASAQVTSEPLIEGAWYHCLYWVTRAAGGARADCDGRAGTATTVTLGSLDAATPLTLGGAARPRVAHVALYRVAPGGLGAATTWLDVGARRFAALTGALPSVAHGTVLPRPGLRATAAYLDLQATAGAPRRLFLVGLDWARVVCRTDDAGTHDCGYLSEARRARVAPVDPAAWTAAALSVVADPSLVVDGAPSVVGLVAEAASTPHTLSFTGTFGANRQVLSFFARAAAGGSVGVSVAGSALAVFDVSAGTVVSAPAGVRATIEPWGNGIFRCACAFDAPATAVTYVVHVLGPAAAEPFAGDGATVDVSLGGLQIDVAATYAGSPLAVKDQAADQLTFVADDGNLPAGTTVSVDLRTILPAGPHLTLVPPDQAVLNLNRGGTFDDQVQLFVTGDGGKLKFWGLSGGVTHWTFDHPTSLVDGAIHAIHAAWTTSTARVVIDQVADSQPAIVTSPTAFALDRIDVGFSMTSSGALEGLVAGLRIAGTP
jgi:hypothetical protein